MRRRAPYGYVPWQPPIYRERLGRIAIPYAAPWLAVVPLAAVAEVLHWSMDTVTRSSWVALALGLVVSAVSGVAWWAGRPRGPLMQAVAVVTVGGWGVWLIVAFIGGLHVGTVTAALLLDMLVAGAHNTMRLLRRSGADTALADGFDEFAGAVRSMQRGRLRTVEHGEGRIRARLAVPVGDDIDAAAARAKRTVSAAAGVHPDEVRSTVVTGNTATIEYVDTGAIDGPVEWPGPSLPGASIADAPIPVAVGDDGSRWALWLPGDEAEARNGTNVLVTGVTGAGKTGTVRMIAADLATRRDVELWWLDPVKGIQTFGPIAAGLDRVADTDRDAVALLRELFAEVRRRNRYLGERGLAQWERDCGLDYLVVAISDATVITRNSALLSDIVATCRTAGVSVMIDVQRPVHDALPVTARTNVTTVLCHGISEQRDGTLYLSRESLEAGATPWRLKNHKPGALYIEAQGLPPQRLGRLYRAYRAKPDQIREAIASRSVAGDEPKAGLTLVPPLDDSAPVDELPMSAIDAQRLVDARIRELFRAGRTELRPADFAAVLDQTGRGASWLTGQLKARCNGVTPTLAAIGTGRYRILGEPA